MNGRGQGKIKCHGELLPTNFTTHEKLKSGVHACSLRKTPNEPTKRSGERGVTLYRKRKGFSQQVRRFGKGAHKKGVVWWGQKPICGKPPKGKRGENLARRLKKMAGTKTRDRRIGGVLLNLQKKCKSCSMFWKGGP